jgi:acyl-[acyl-carrier-protein]-phospholipid O-acyltransferase/long-chain-fatty-acid--[acyl-carrier-protein] ligase
MTVEPVPPPPTGTPADVEGIVRRSRKSIFHAFLRRARIRGGGTLAVIDGDGKSYTYSDISRAAFALGGPIARASAPHETIGVMLPTGFGVVATVMALTSRGRTPAMVNFTSGERNIKSAMRAAKATKVVTARKFVEMAKLEGLVDQLKDELQFLFLEDFKEQLSPADKARAVLGPLLPRFFSASPDPDSAGVILFTSGTEGDPKGVVLSHANIIANIEQIAQHVRIEPTDIFFNPLPTFHCYGLTGGTLWPILVGYPVVLHPSPLQTKIIPQRIEETGATVMFGTDTFLQQYMRSAQDGALKSLRLAVCGAERVKDETRAAAKSRFGFEVLEGYGVTEASPVLAANQPGDIRAGTVGKLLPGVEARLEPVEGLSGGARLFVRGPNVMTGYISAAEPGVLKAPADGWHDTGDVVSFDADGYMTIRGRIKRFAKIGGEMVSLAVVENCATAVWPDHLHAAAILPDDRRGEQIVLITDCPNPDRSLLVGWAQNHGVPELAVPKKIVTVAEVPVLGTGKLDYVAINRMAADAMQEKKPAPPADDPNAGRKSAVRTAFDAITRRAAE